MGSGPSWEPCHCCRPSNSAFLSLQDKSPNLISNLSPRILCDLAHDNPNSSYQLLHVVCEQGVSWFDGNVNLPLATENRFHPLPIVDKDNPSKPNQECIWCSSVDLPVINFEPVTRFQVTQHVAQILLRLFSQNVGIRYRLDGCSVLSWFLF